VRRSGGTGPYKRTVTRGWLPWGLSLSNTGVMTGRPLARGTWRFTVAVIDRWGVRSAHAYSLTIR